MICLIVIKVQLNSIKPMSKKQAKIINNRTISLALCKVVFEKLLPSLELLYILPRYLAWDREWNRDWKSLKLFISEYDLLLCQGLVLEYHKHNFEILCLIG